MHPRELLTDTLTHIPPARAIEGLMPDDAARRLSGAPHSVAEILAHMTFWLEWFMARSEGRAEPIVAHAASGWPAAGAGDWPDLARRFLAGLERLVALGERDTKRRVAPAIELPPFAEYTMGDVLVHVANHNAHHLGQIITLRQMMQRWPPPSGRFSW